LLILAPTPPEALPSTAAERQGAEMVQLKQGEYVGIVFDALNDQVMEISPTIRATPEAAHRDAVALIAVVNEQPQAGLDGLVDDSYAFVLGASGIAYDYPAQPA
jgi:hypothetical protein